VTPTKPFKFTTYYNYLIFFCLIFVDVHAQINQHQEFANNVLEKLYPTKIYQGKKIKSIEVELGLKRENARIEKTGKKYVYNFQEDGRLASFIEVIKKEYEYDSIFTFHFYNKELKQHIARTFDHGKYFTLYDNFDDAGRLVKSMRCQETNLTDDFRFFKIGQQTILQIESYQYEAVNENQVKKKFLNDQNLVYKEGIIYYEGNPKVLKAQEFAFSTTGVKVNYTYTYDDQGRQLETNYFSNAAGELKESTRYTYNASVLTEDKYYRNSSMKNQRFYFYGKDNGLLESILSKSGNAYLIDIYNFSFTFYQ
jgi:hypothetical protein